MEPGPVTFPSPTGGRGVITQAVVPVKNPHWRWWAFWRPRVVAMQVELPPKVIAAGDTLKASGLTISER